jgi:hypothetical protein
VVDEDAEEHAVLAQLGLEQRAGQPHRAEVKRRRRPGEQRWLAEQLLVCPGPNASKKAFKRPARP